MVKRPIFSSIFSRGIHNVSPWIFAGYRRVGPADHLCRFDRARSVEGAVAVGCQVGFRWHFFGGPWGPGHHWYLGSSQIDRHSVNIQDLAGFEWPWSNLSTCCSWLTASDFCCLQAVKDSMYSMYLDHSWPILRTELFPCNNKFVPISWGSKLCSSEHGMIIQDPQDGQLAPCGSKK